MSVKLGLVALALVLTCVHVFAVHGSNQLLQALILLDSLAIVLVATALMNFARDVVDARRPGAARARRAARATASRREWTLRRGRAAARRAGRGARTRAACGAATSC